MFGLAISDLFKNYYKLDPGEAQTLTTSIVSAWYLKIFIGIAIDGISKYFDKRRYFIATGLVQSACLLLVSYSDFKSARVAALFLGISSFANAVADVVISAFICEAARLDPEDGAKDL